MGCYVSGRRTFAAAGSQQWVACHKVSKIVRGAMAVTLHVVGACGVMSSRTTEAMYTMRAFGLSFFGFAMVIKENSSLSCGACRLTTRRVVLTYPWLPNHGDTSFAFLKIDETDDSQCCTCASSQESSKCSILMSTCLLDSVLSHYRRCDGG